MSKIAVVVGASRGIGLELCKQLSALDYKVAAVVRTASDALVAQKPWKVIPNIDVGNDAHMTVLAEALKDIKVDLFIHNAGMIPEGDTSTLEDIKSFDGIQQAININAIGPARTCKAMIPFLSEGSKVMLISTRMASIGDGPGGKFFGYRMSKTALNMFGANWASEMKSKGVSVLIAHPGTVETDMTSGFGAKAGKGECVSPEQSVNGLIKRIDALDITNTGMFYHQNGTNLPW